MQVDDIPGWFHFAPLYDLFAREVPPGGAVVELGVFCGKSLAYLARAVKPKQCKVFGVDTFLGSPEFGTGVKFEGKPWDAAPRGILATMAIQNLEAVGALGDVTLIVSDSARAAELFRDGSVWAVMVDADHSHGGVLRDLSAWWPKVAPGGYIAGDDFREDFPGVESAVREFFPEVHVDPSRGVWFVRKEVGS
jgi:predicted O-methyltransferase YrrM